jgi:serine/threonine-protein kinase
MVAVYEVVHEQIGRRAAIKILHPELMQHPEVVARFMQEARATNQVQHPGIVAIYEVGEIDRGEGRRAYLVMELLGGQNLGQRLHQRGGHLPEAEVVPLARQVAGALAAAHRRQVIHRDLKTENVMIVPDPEMPSGERIKVLDFGIAKVTLTDGQLNMRTSTGVIMGTPHYMSPEQCRGAGHVGDRTDVYSLGVMIFEMMSGRTPFMAAGAGEMIAQQIYAAPPKLREVAPWASTELEGLVERLLVKDPASRPAMAEVVAELDRLMVGLRAQVAAGTLETKAQSGASLPAVTAPSQPVVQLQSQPQSQPPPQPQAAPPQPTVQPPPPTAPPLPPRSVLPSEPPGALGSSTILDMEQSRRANRQRTAAVAGGVVLLAAGLLLTGILIGRRGPKDPAPQGPSPVATTAAPPAAPLGAAPPPAPPAEERPAPGPAAVVGKEAPSAPPAVEKDAPEKHAARHRDKDRGQDRDKEQDGDRSKDRGREKARDKVAQAQPAAARAAAGKAPEDALSRRLMALAQQVAPGMKRVGPVMSGYGEDGEEQHRYIDLTAGRCYVFVNVGADSMRALYAYLWDPTGRRVATEKSGLHTSFQHCAAMSGSYHYLAKAADGDGEFRAAVYSRE